MVTSVLNPKRLNPGRLINWWAVSGYVVLFAAVTFLVLSGSSKFSLAGSNAQVSASALPVDQLPQDQLASLSIAHSVARMTGIGELPSVTDQANSVWSHLRESSMANVDLSTKPQVIPVDFRSYKDITHYTVRPGDSLSSIASKFGVSQDTIRWSNGITGWSVSTGQKLWIPPVNGIVYKVKQGDTAASLASKYNASKSQIIHFNDAEVNGLKVGTRILLPGASEDVAPVYYYIPSGGSYPYGQCTWYASKYGGVPGGWGNADNWDNMAQVLSGWVWSSTPKVGAVAQTDRGIFGHVAVVDAVSGNSMKITDMNHEWDGQISTRWVSVSSFDGFIYRS